MQSHPSLSPKYWITIAVITVAVLIGGYGLVRGFSAGTAVDQGDPGADDDPSDVVVVQVVSPKPGGMDRTTSQPCSVLAYESVPLYAAVSGYLKTLNVDIGSVVKKGQTLAVIDVPELVLQKKLNEAAVKRAGKKVNQMHALKKVYQADLKAAQAAVKQAGAFKKTTEAMLSYHSKRFDRLFQLGKKGVVDAGVVDEAQERYEAAQEAVNTATESINAAEAREAAATAKILQADADVEEALAAVEVAEAEKDKTQQMVDYATIPAPIDGVVTQRSVFEKHFIRAATINANQPPLLTVERTDKVRVVVMVPDRDILYADVGDEATIEVDAIPGMVFKAPIARIASAEDVKSRTMKVEIDLDNPTGKLRQGMYGKVTIILEKSVNVLALPASCIVKRIENTNKAQVYVVKNNQAMLTTVTLVGESGSKVGVVGLKATDNVIANPSAVSANGMKVTTAPLKESKG
jgi:RND family efflux transporter MFP subunit